MISVIIPAFNAQKTLPSCLQALANQVNLSEPIEIIVVDDGSQDNTAVVAEAENVTLIKHSTQKGAAAARNSGIAAARGELIYFTDADCIPRPNWAAEMRRPFTDEKIMGCKGIYASNQSSLIARFVQIEYEDKYDLLRQQSTIDFIDTYSAAYRSEILRQFRGFDERIFYVEDQELSFRLAAQNYRMVFQETAVVSHLHSDNLAKYVRKKFWIGYWKSQIIRRFPARAVKDSHTPQVLKLQILLAGTFLTLAATTILFPPLLLLALLVFVLFGLTTIPFIKKAQQKDKAVAAAAPFLLFARAAALGFGTAYGLLHRLPNIDTMSSSL